MHKNVKTADLQGAFYPSGAEELNDLLENLLAGQANSKLENNKMPKGIIVPHAGYVYSGECAAAAYNIVQQYAENYDVIYLFGPAHNKYFSGLRSLTNQYCATPLGNLEVDQDEVSNLVAEDLLSLDNEVFDEEHSLETQLPFIYKIFGNKVKIVPILIGDSSSKEVLPILYKMNEKERRLFVISSDLSHFLSLEEEQQTDKDTIDNIEHCNNALIDYEDACGATAVNASIEYAKLEEFEIKNVSFRNSSEISNDKERVVGYASFIITKPR